jgi:subtilisin family serine protease
MNESRRDRLPPVIYAQASPISRGGTSVFDAAGVITADQASNFISDERIIDEAVSRLAAAGFQILQRSAVTINIAGPPSLYEAFFKTRLVTEERPVIKPGARQATATFIDTADTDVPGLIDASRSPVADLLEGVAIEEPVYPFQEANPPAVNYWHLEVPDQVADLLNADAVHERGIRGAGVRLMMVDTGWFQHPYFVQRNIEGTVVLGPGAANPLTDENGHGTGESANVFAVAPDVQFTMVKANMVNITGAFNAAVAQTPPPQIVSNSWGYDRRLPPLSAIQQALAASVALAVANGMVVVFSAGNGQWGFPAQHPDVIAVGGVFLDQNGAMQASDYASGFASNVFPGRNVPDVCGLVGVLPHAIYIALPIPAGCEIDRELAGGRFPNDDETRANDGWAVFSGTSAACPQVAGICALLRQVNPGLTPAAIRTLLTETGRDVTVGHGSEGTGSPAAGPGFDLATGFGLADAATAVAAAEDTVRRGPAPWLELLSEHS